jgi:hypothetical protein
VSGNVLLSCLEALDNNPASRYDNVSAKDRLGSRLARHWGSLGYLSASLFVETCPHLVVFICQGLLQTTARSTTYKMGGRLPAASFPSLLQVCIIFAVQVYV